MATSVIFGARLVACTPTSVDMNILKRTRVLTKNHGIDLELEVIRPHRFDLFYFIVSSDI